MRLSPFSFLYCCFSLEALAQNQAIEFDRNQERFNFLKVSTYVFSPRATNVLSERNGQRKKGDEIFMPRAREGYFRIFMIICCESNENYYISVQSFALSPDEMCRERAQNNL